MTDRCQYRNADDVRCLWPRHPGNVHNFTEPDTTTRPPDPMVHDCCGSPAMYGHPRMCWVQWQYLKVTVIGMSIMVGLLVWFCIAVATRR